MTLHAEEMKNIKINEAERKTVLLVDDDSGLLGIYEKYFTRKGHEVKTAMTAEETKKYSEENFDLAIIDGLEGRCFDVHDIINAKRKLICTGDIKLIEEAENRGIEVHDKLKESLRSIIK